MRLQIVIPQDTTSEIFIALPWSVGFQESQKKLYRWVLQILHIESALCFVCRMPKI